MTRKCIYAMNVQAIADATGRITWASCACEGARPDASAFGMTNLFSVVAGWTRWCLVGDEAYTLDNTMLIPYRNAREGASHDEPLPPPRHPNRTRLTPTSSHAGTAEDDYNYFQSLTRQPVERAFGMIERRWGILWRRLEVCSPARMSPALLPSCPHGTSSAQVSLHHVPLVVFTIIHLHNICMEHAVPDVSLEELESTFQPLRRTSDDEDQRGRRHDLERSWRRDKVRDALQLAGFRRPQLAAGVTRRN